MQAADRVGNDAAPVERIVAYLSQSSLARQFLHSIAVKLPTIAIADAPIGGATGKPQWLQLTFFARQLQKKILAKKMIMNASCK